MKRLKGLTEKLVRKALTQEIRIHELVIFPTSRCNLSCKHCSFECKSDSSDNISIDRLKSVIDSGIDIGVKTFIVI